ncbi:hypothetical protein VQ049_13550, partial [Staphylococcus arlettae]
MAESTAIRLMVLAPFCGRFGPGPAKTSQGERAAGARLNFDIDVKGAFLRFAAVLASRKSGAGTDHGH